MFFKKNFLFLALFYIFLILLFTKIDYRFIEEFTCCQDDHDYYSHAETIAIDFDLNYSNQYEGYEEKRYYKNGVVAPKGFIGSGLLASPFLYIGNLFENIISNKSFIFNYKILFYSLSAIFYFFLSIYLIYASIRLLQIKINLQFIFLLFLGSGVAYYAFERYSMTHIYEVFTTCLLIFITTKFYTEKNNLDYFSFLIPIVTIVAINVRWVNYHIFFIPFIVKFLFKDKIQNNNYLLKSKYFYFSYALSAGVFLLLNKYIYDIVTFNPVRIYGSSGRLDSFIEADTISLLKIVSTSMIQILFSEEFGIFWFSPIIFAGLAVLFYLLIFSSKEKFVGYLFLLILYGVPFGSVVLWQSTASSYGYRYLYSLLPIALLVFVKWKSLRGNNLLNNYLLFFSIFGALSILFFETTPGTSLSENINSFNVNERFSQPEYLTNYIASFTEINSYLKIFTTSFLGVLFFKLISSFFQIEEIISFLEKLNLPVNNQDFINFLYNIETISLNQIILFLVVLLSIVLKYVSQIVKHDD